MKEMKNLKNSQKVGLYIAIGTVALLSLCAGALVIARKCEKCKNY